MIIKTFKQWIQLKEMAGTSVVMGNKCVTDVGPDAQILGDPCASKRAETKPTGVKVTNPGRVKRSTITK